MIISTGARNGINRRINEKFEIQTLNIISDITTIQVLPISLTQRGIASLRNVINGDTNGASLKTVSSSGTNYND